ATILSVVSIVSMLICGASFVGVVYANSKLSSQADYIIYAEEFGAASGYLTEQVRSYAASGDKEYYNNYWHEVNTAKTRENSVAALEALGLEPSETALINEVYSISDGLIPLEEQAMEYVQRGNLTAALNLLYGDEYVSGVEKVNETLEKFSTSIQDRMEQERSEMQRVVNVMTVVALVAIVATLVIQVFVVKFVMKELLTPILKIRDQVAKLSEGDLNSRLDLVEDSTEIGQTVHSMKEFQHFQKELISDIDYLLVEMSKGNFDVDSRREGSYKGDYKNILVSLKKINNTLDSTLKKILSAAGMVESGASQIAMGSQSLAQSATEQASSVQELSFSISNISESVQNTASDSQQANDQAVQAGYKVNECSRQMHDLIEAMDRISHSSEEINKVINVIENIAFQTNILALNAAVEAARAGNAGKGFAVVADEVRNLAGKSAEASKSTAELIYNSQEAVAHGLALVNETAASLEEVVEITKQSAATFARIAEASEMEAESIKQVTEGVDQISSVIQTNSATSEQSAATSEELSSQAQIMKNLLDYFKLK
ncbi:MAG: methyl-accepting chemotaxis protein, partial [Firmicutes bacterium]|nr:methyl-accepting chemotaxis protein [Bacillota bacterium]